MFFSLFNKNSGSIEKEMDNFIEKEDKGDKEKVENYLHKKLKELYEIYNI